jgi:phosphoribosylglycinamide formyltransferase 2
MITSLATPLSPAAFKVLLLGSGELGKELVIELQRLVVETIAVDRYGNAPAQQVAHRAHVIDMTDGAALRALIETERPDLVVPEIEAIATTTLVELEREGMVTVIPTARAAFLTMNREVAWPRKNSTCRPRPIVSPTRSMPCARRATRSAFPRS